MLPLFDQPFGNPTAHLNYLLSSRAREHITVALCGAGGDELFAGYPRYRAEQLARALGRAAASRLFQIVTTTCGSAASRNFSFVGTAIWSSDSPIGPTTWTRQPKRRWWRVRRRFDRARSCASSSRGAHLPIMGAA